MALPTKLSKAKQLRHTLLCFTTTTVGPSRTSRKKLGSQTIAGVLVSLLGTTTMTAGQTFMSAILARTGFTTTITMARSQTLPRKPELRSETGLQAPRLATMTEMAGLISLFRVTFTTTSTILQCQERKL